MAAIKRRVITIGGKGYSLTPRDIIDVATSVATISVDPSALNRRSSNLTSQISFSLPNYFSDEESRASLLLLLNKILLYSSPSAADQLVEILNRDSLPSDYVLSSPDFDFSTAAVAGISALFDYRTAVFSPIADAVAAVSCEALRADVSAFNLADSGNGSIVKDTVSVASDCKVFLNGSKLVKSGKKLLDSAVGDVPEVHGCLLDSAVADVPEVHGCLRRVSREFHSITRVILKSGFTAGSNRGMSTALASLALSVSNLGKISARRVELMFKNSVADNDLSSGLLKLFEAECPHADRLKELQVSAAVALAEEDYLSCMHKINELLDVVTKIVSWEAVTAFISLEGSELFGEKVMGDNGNITEPSSAENAKPGKKGDKKKKGVPGKGSLVLLKFFKDTLLIGETTFALEKFALDFVSLLDPRGLGFEAILKKVKEIVESNDNRRLPKLPKGTRDFAEKQMAVRERAFAIITNVFKKHGATALDTPDFEMRETLMGKYGEDSKLIFDLADQGGELCSLRYDLTVPFARYVAMNGLTSFKRYQIAKVHRRDKPSKGRYREFYQCDFDIAGQFEKMGPDFEVVYTLLELLDELNIGEYEVKLNHRKLLDGMLAICGVPQAKFRTICSSIDKLDKQTFEQIKKEMVEEKGLSEETADKIGALVKHRGSPMELLPKLQQEGSDFLQNSDAVLALNDLEILFKTMENSKCTDKVVFDLSLARGLEYYTGVIFEAVFKGGSEVGSIAAGGRYDTLIGTFGPKQVHAVGMSLGIERVFAIMEEQQAKETTQKVRAIETQVLVSILGDDLPLAGNIVSELWSVGVKAEFSVNKRMQKHLDRATDSGIPFMVIVGAQEVEKGIVKVKDLTARTEDEVPRSQLVQKLKELLETP
ncbi:hypothetical protein OROHE_017137 [Orobanche hederae]